MFNQQLPNMSAASKSGAVTGSSSFGPVNLNFGKQDEDWVVWGIIGLAAISILFSKK
jgi:hypothetical protein